ncbi:MAG: hypothetical protein ACXWUG_11110 [Polyangiales bacterium]
MAEQRQNSKTSVAEKKRALKRALSLRKKRPLSHESTHANRKATYVLEDHSPGTQPSRKSTRKASNRMRETSTLELRQEASMDTPESRASRSSVHDLRVRGR